MRSLIAFSLVLFCFVGYSQLRLPALFSDHMVLQQESEVAIWGWDVPGKKVSIVGSWGGKKVKTKVAMDGKWFTRIQTPSFGGPFTLTIRGSSDKVLEDVMVGEVWICSGQSNMEWSANSGFFGGEEEVLRADNSAIRLIDVPHVASVTPNDDFEGKWQVSSPESMRSFSAIGYLFGKELTIATGVPIGLIGSNWGGTPSEAWTERTWLSTSNVPEIIINNQKLEASNAGNSELHPHQPGVLFNGMIAPLIPYGIRGVIWYQGESNAVGNRASEYALVFPELIKNWRSQWDKEFSFYWAQIAPFNYQIPYVGAMLMESQEKSLTVGKSGMAVLTDIGNPNDIHPKNKIDVAKRLSRIALAKDYGQNIDYSGPVFKQMETLGRALFVTFKHAEEGLDLRSNEYFEIAGSDRNFFPAEAELRDGGVLVSSEKVDQPVALRYGFWNTAEASLFDKNGLPASPFRTDSWPIITESVRFIQTFEKESGVLSLQMETAPSFEIVYTTDGTTPGSRSNRYKQPVRVGKSMEFKARAISNDGMLGPVSPHRITWHSGIGKSIVFSEKYAANFTGGGDYALLDGVKGTVDFGAGQWQAWRGNDVIATIDLGTHIDKGQVEVGFLRHTGAWIFPPKSVVLEGSSDGESFTIFDQWTLRPSSPEDPPGRGNIRLQFGEQTQYLRFKIQSQGDCPEWHAGNGNTCWLFLDEIEIHPSITSYGHQD